MNSSGSGLRVLWPGGDMLGLAEICWAIWKARNKVCLGKKLIKDPVEIIFSACSYMFYWAGLYSEDMQSMISAGVETMMWAAIRIMRRQARPTPVRITCEEHMIIEEEEDEEWTDEGRASKDGME
jgi:hypothetical protein